MSQAILVTYASRTGTTQSVAEAIGQTLVEQGMSVEVRPMNEVSDLTPYRAVVAGSAIQGGKWLPEAMQFVRANRVVLAQKPFASFMVCITLGGKGEKYRQGVANWMAPVRDLVRPVSEGLFAGRLDMSKAPFSLDSLMFRLAVVTGALPQGDHRDWQAIRAWAQGVAPMLTR